MKALSSLSASKRGILLFSSGTAMAQFITVLGSFAIARLYAPAEFGVFAMFAAASTIAAALAGWRYEVAVVIPEEEKDARAILFLACGLGALGALGLLGVLLLAWLVLGDFLGHGLTLLLCIMLPINAWLIHLLVVLRHWTNRFRRYRIMAVLAMFETLAINVISITLGYIGFGAPGLIFGAVVGRLITMLLLLLKGVEKTERRDILGSDRATLREVASRFRNHPRHLLPAQMVGVIGRQMPVLTLSLCFGATIVGLYSMAQRFVSLPTTTMAKAVGEIYRERVGRRARNGKAFRDLFLKTLSVLTGVGVVVMTSIYIFAPQIFELALGPKWVDATGYVRILLVAAFFQFVFIPIDKGAIITGRTGFFFAWHFIRFTASLIVLGIVWLFELEPITALWLIVIVNALIYMLNGAANYTFSKTVPDNAGKGRAHKGKDLE